jgi:hypothetical protein
MMGTLSVEDAWRSVSRRPWRCTRPVRGEIRMRLRATGWPRPDCMIGVHALEDGTIVFLQVEEDHPPSTWPGAGFSAKRTTGDSALDAAVMAEVRRYVRTIRHARALRQAA